MQKNTTPRQNISSLINNIRSIADNISREVGSNPSDSTSRSQISQNQLEVQDTRASVISQNQRPTLTNNQTSPDNLRNSIAPKQPLEIGTLIQGIQRAHAKVDEVVRYIPVGARTNSSPLKTSNNMSPPSIPDRNFSSNGFAFNNQETGQTRSLNELGINPNLNHQFGSLPNLPISSRPDQPGPLYQGNPFAKNAAGPTISSNFPMSASTASLGVPAQGSIPNERGDLKASLYGAAPQQAVQGIVPSHYSNPSFGPLKTESDGPQREPLIKMIPVEYDPRSTENQTRSLNEMHTSHEFIEENRPKSLLYASNFFKPKGGTPLQTPSQNKYKNFFPRQYPPNSTAQKSNSKPVSQNTIDQSENGEEYYTKEGQADYYGFSNPNQEKQVHRTSSQNRYLSNQKSPAAPVEKILEKLRNNEERHKRQRLEEDQYRYNDTDDQINVKPVIRSGRRTSMRRESRDRTEGVPSLAILDNSMSESSIKVASRQDIEKKIELLGKASRKHGAKKVIPSLGGGQLAVEKKEIPDLNKNPQVFGKDKGSGGQIARHDSRKRSSANRDKNSEEFMVKNLKRRTSQQGSEYNEGRDFERSDNGEDYEDENFYGESERKFKQPRQEEQEAEDAKQIQQSRRGSKSRGKIQNGDMVWSSQKKPPKRALGEI